MGIVPFSRQRKPPTELGLERFKLSKTAMAKPLSVHLMAYTYYECYPLERFGMESVESTAIRWALGCVNSRLAARGSQEAGFTQPKPRIIAHLCTVREDQ